jgi:hypothetical protein
MATFGVMVAKFQGKKHVMAGATTVYRMNRDVMVGAGVV